MLYKLQQICKTIEKNRIIQAISTGLILIIPVLMIGSFSLVFSSMPIEAYQNFIHSFSDGILIEFFNMVHTATFGFLSVFMAGAISFAIGTLSENRKSAAGVMISSVASFLILSGVTADDKTAFSKAVGASGMFTAIFASIAFSYLYLFFQRRINSKSKKMAESVNSNFNHAISGILPCVAAVSTAAILNLLLVRAFGVNSFNGLFTYLINKLFHDMGLSFSSALLFVCMSSFLWFLGIHGNDTLQSVNESLFEPAILENMNNIASGLPATEIFSKTFMDIFVLIGGCGSALCLLAAMLLFSNRKSSRSLAKLSAVPMFFNISEPLIFGLPVVFNPILLVPFIITPVVSLAVAYIATAVGLVPICSTSVEWTTPILLGGYIATGSFRGSLLQLINLMIGIMIYKPFVQMYDEEKQSRAAHHLQALINILREKESSNEQIVLTEMNGEAGEMALMLAEDLKNAFAEKEIKIFYQPQHDNNGNCIGAEALLRWKHSMLGFIYPPLVIKLAEETGILENLERGIFDLADEEMKVNEPMLNGSFKVSVNVSAKTIQKDSFVEFLEEFAGKRERNFCMCIEITEQTALAMDERLTANLDKLRKLGYLLAIDDFSMGSTSLKYLQESAFDIVKLDGGIVKAIETNERSINIVKSIVYLSESLGFDVLAEFVETEELRRALEEAGCKQYQGYLFSPAISADKFEEYLIKNIQ